MGEEIIHKEENRELLHAVARSCSILRVSAILLRDPSLPSGADASNGLDGTYRKKGCDRKNGGERRRGMRKRNAAPLAVADRTTDRGAGGLVAGDERKASKAMFGGAIMK